VTNLDDIIAIRDRFLATWDDAVPFVFENDSPTKEPNQIWARFNIAPGDERRLTIGSTNYEVKGRVYLQIMVPAGMKLAPARTIEARFVNAFREWSSADYRIRFDTPEYSVDDSEDNYFILRTSILYRARH
jgi:hypothetical protein